MLIIGILFVLAGLAIAYFANEFGTAARVARFAGFALVLIGLGAIAVDLFDLDADAKAAVDHARSSWGHRRLRA